MSEVSTEPAGDLVERIRKILLTHIHIGNNGFVDLVQGIPEASCAIAAIPDRAALAAEVESLKTQLERERMRLAACGVVAVSDTQESAARNRDMHADYKSASCDDVARRVDECMTLRSQLAASQAELARLREALTLLQSFGCPACSGDCGSANPPVTSCPMTITHQALAALKDTQP
jgi:hypothetical protein